MIPAAEQSFQHNRNEEVENFVPTVNELKQVVASHITELLKTDWDFVVYNKRGLDRTEYDSRWSRLSAIAIAIGEDDFRDAVNAACRTFRPMRTGIWQVDEAAVRIFAYGRCEPHDEFARAVNQYNTDRDLVALGTTLARIEIQKLPRHIETSGMTGEIYLDVSAGAKIDRVTP